MKDRYYVKRAVSSGWSHYGWQVMSKSRYGGDRSHGLWQGQGEVGLLRAFLKAHTYANFLREQFEDQQLKLAK